MLNIFQYLEKTKSKPIPLKYKILNNLPLNNDELIYNGRLSLYNSKIEQLPNNLTVNGWLDINSTNISELPDDLIVNGDLYCYRTPLGNNIKKDRSLLKKYQKQIKGKIFYG